MMSASLVEGGEETPHALPSKGSEAGVALNSPEAAETSGLTGMQAAVSPPAKPVSVLPSRSIQRPRAPAMSA